MSTLLTNSYAVVNIIGVNAQCDTALVGCTRLLITVTELCIDGVNLCPQNSVASFTDSNRFWGRASAATQACRTSTNGGSIWSACTTQPFGVGENSTPEHYGSASDGSVIAISTITTGTVGTIRRSIDNGTSWSTVFSEPGISYSTALPGGNAEGQLVVCLSDGRCEFVGNMAGGSGRFRVYRSNDNGTSWVAGETSAVTTGCPSSGTVWNGLIGISPFIGTTACGGGIMRTYSASSDVWSLSAAWGTSPGDCWGPVIYNGANNVICNNVTNYTLYSSTGVVISNLILPGSIPTISIGAQAYSTGTNIMYIVATGTSSKFNVYVSINNLANFTKIFTTTNTSGSARGGNMYAANGCIYFSVNPTFPIFGKIC